MKRIWDFIIAPQNLAALTAIGALLAFLWNHLRVPSVPPAKSVATAPASGQHPGGASNQASARDNAITIQDTSAGGNVSATIGTAAGEKTK